MIILVLSFLSTFAILVSAAYLLNATLAAAGYDISRLILIGLDTSPQHNMPLDTAYTQFIALALALATSVFVYAKFASMSRLLPRRRLTPPQNAHRSSTQRTFSSSPSGRKSSSLPTLPCASLSSLAPPLHLSSVTALRCRVPTTSSASPLASTSPSQPRSTARKSPAATPPRAATMTSATLTS